MQEAIGRLCCVSELSKNMCISAAAGEDNATSEAELATVFPSFTWLLRDFSLTLSADGKEINENQCASLLNLPNF